MDGAQGLRSYPWRLSYRTSSMSSDGRPADILHDFYLPALRLSVRYDRVAGYFSSSSLAAASQGFSAFVGRQGRMRLITGADLDPEDVRAILAGDAQRLASCLNRVLEQPESWPENVRNGVTLLAWMVARGYLEVRVAFRLHRITGEPLPLDSVEDGYVHEKWLVMADEFGNRLYGSGSLNESRTALTLNAENIDIHCDWWSETDRRRVEDAVRNFEALWTGQVPHMLVLPLPEAVRLRLIRLAEHLEQLTEIDGTVVPLPIEVTPSALELLRFAVIRDGPKLPGGRFVGIETAPVEPWPHQRVVARRLVKTWPYSYLLCDEVGLGKTIEAGLAFRSLYLSGMAKRILIAAPAGLTQQWLRQMGSKMLMSFGCVNTSPRLMHEYVFPKEERRPAEAMFTPDLTIVSTGLMTERRRSEFEQAEPFDIVLVDEAHTARRRNPSAGIHAHAEYVQLYTLLQEVLRGKTRSLWLATATPMQLDPVEVCDLLALTHRVGAFQFDPTLVMEYYNLIRKIINNEEMSENDWMLLHRVVTGIKTQDPVLWDFVTKYVVTPAIRAPLRQWLDYKRIPRGRDRQLMSRFFFSVSPLSRVMMRHTRKLLEIYREKGQLSQNLAERCVLQMPDIRMTPAEERIYQLLDEYCRGWSEQLRHNNKFHRSSVLFWLSFLRLRFSSSLYAFQQTIRNRLHKVEATLQQQSSSKRTEYTSNDANPEDIVYNTEEEQDAAAVEMVLQGRTLEDLQWERRALARILDAIGDSLDDSGKMLELLARLNERRIGSTGRIRQTVIFTRFYDTLVDIVSRLQRVDPTMRIGTYSGKGARWFDPEQNQMKDVDREEVKERFLRGDIDVLVCTDAAAEGLNLQTADLLINFDLGWNPMKIEQRIGRIDRIGQKHSRILVLNLCYRNSAEQIVYGRLLERLEKARLIVGTQQLSLLPVLPEEFLQLEEGQLSQEELERRVTERLKKQQEHLHMMEISASDLFDIYKRLSENEHERAPVDSTAIWEAFSESEYLLNHLGCQIRHLGDRPVIELKGIPGVPDGVVLTVSPALYEEGLGERRVHFATYGDPYFDAVLNYMKKFGLPSCIRRISVTIGDQNRLEMVAYVVACLDDQNRSDLRMICKWDDLRNMRLDEGRSISEEELVPFYQRLVGIARDEFDPILAAERLEKANVRAAYLQQWMIALIAEELLEEKWKDKSESFGAVLRKLEGLEEKDRLLVTGLPGDLLRVYSNDLVFEADLPFIGEKVSLTIPAYMIKSTIGFIRQIGDMVKNKEGRENVSYHRLHAAIKRRIEDVKRRMSM
ncbi:MAG: helicase [Candidatus Reconcilbacillus cellulovorans]|uniref:Helicase n=1 Tax=Candidatus Reconcilbacillus cellulovorans TaxID=1906605 RepID=A0A2A6E0Q1_9BACL|nr:MAG: helicase [Candidatus Reconcilbacillus cellulovorans]